MWMQRRCVLTAECFHRKRHTFSLGQIHSCTCPTQTPPGPLLVYFNFSTAPPPPSNTHDDIILHVDCSLHCPQHSLQACRGCCAGKKRKRRVHQPRPVHKYDLDVAALEFSSTQQMHDEHPQGDKPDSMMAKH